MKPLPRHISLWVTATLGVSAAVHADSFDARAMGMSSAGVATADYSRAASLNPAAMAGYNRDNSHNLHLDLGLQASDKDELLDNAEELSDTLDEVDQMLIGETTADTLINQLEAIDNSQIWLQGGGGLSLSLPIGDYSTSLFARTNLMLAGTTLVDDGDVTLIENARDLNAVFDSDSLNSAVLLQGALITEGGVTIARQFGDMSFGIAPKLQQVETFEYLTTVADFDDEEFDADEYRSEDSGFNLDLGYQQAFGNWQVGATLSNLIAKDYKTISGEKVTLEPRLTLGGGYRNGWLTAAFDIDANAAEIPGLGADTQFARIGLEMNAWGWAQLRLGYKTDLKSAMDDTVSLGLGLTPFGVINMDISALYGDNDTYGAAMQFGVNF
ncbi:conjugal transfer protein TraF [Microbulbifer thermotolerans]|uniref:conjugal transfer protein TraF n=1 Tax=Microbulbifer thermotolerans TaxID=252514 RepID=UPI00224B9146|nr:conjugal transfer protein TraF [Microbulbifer thermotolerans]MCX2841324.1 conjugal transfer protein TraF [Microbulbifer thermotolerans]